MSKKKQQFKLEDIFEINGRQIKIKDDFDSSFATKLFVNHINTQLSQVPPAEVPLKELILQASTVTLGKVQSALNEFQALLGAIGETLTPKPETLVPPSETIEPVENQ
jgi:hypothetical protein